MTIDPFYLTVLLYLAVAVFGLLLLGAAGYLLYLCTLIFSQWGLQVFKTTSEWSQLFQTLKATRRVGGHVAARAILRQHALEKSDGRPIMVEWHDANYAIAYDMFVRWVGRPPQTNDELVEFVGDVVLSVNGEFKLAAQGVQDGEEAKAQA